MCVVKLNQNDEPTDLKQAMKIVEEKWNKMNLSKNDLKNKEPNIKQTKLPDHFEAHVLALINDGIS